jgi:hypothetical protein
MRDKRAATDSDAPLPDVRRAAERVLDDEALRDDLSDEGYLPLVDLALALADSRGHTFPDTDTLAQAMRDLIRNAVALAKWQDEAASEALSSSSLLLASERPAIREIALPADPDAASVALAREIERITGVTGDA